MAMAMVMQIGYQATKTIKLTNNKQFLLPNTRTSVDQNRSIRSNDDTAGGMDAQVQLRARAHSTGARSGSVRHAKMERARFLSGQSIAAPAADPLDSLQHFRRENAHRETKAPDATVSSLGTGELVASSNQQQQQQVTPMDSPGRASSGRRYNNNDEAELRDAGPGAADRMEQRKQQQQQQQQRKEDLHDEHRQKKDLLNKKSFTCMLIGARQTGKRTIVKCSVKLLNEFKLAAFEYKKEKMLNKLMNCSEQLQSLMSQQEQLEMAGDHADRRISLAPTDLPRSRINSWLGGGGGNSEPTGGTGTSTGSGGAFANRLLHLPMVGKRRLNSTVSALTAHGRDQQRQQQQQQQYQSTSLQKRRHTTIDHGSSQLPDGVEARGGKSHGDGFHGLPSTAANATAASKDLYLRVDTPNMLTTRNRSSDTRINYANDDGDDDVDDDEDNNNNGSLNQLQVPVPDMPFSRPSNQASEPSTSNNSNTTNLSRPRPAHLLPEAANCGNDLGGQQNHRHQSYSQDAIRMRNLSLVQASQRRKPMLSLKEMNKRLIRILFKTRRQLSDRFLCQRREVQHDQSVQLQQQITTAISQEDNLQWDWPDSFIVVYSISDRNSFEYAKHLIDQLRSIKQEIAPPIILVANKIDLERAKVVKSEEGRIVARKNGCKFLEISCTVGFNMDNLLVGLRTQLILKHHVTLNSIIRQGKILRAPLGGPSRQTNERGETYKTKGHNILVRMYKRYLNADNQELDYDCDNFSKL